MNSLNPPDERTLRKETNRLICSHLDKGHLVHFVVGSASMWPFLESGDELLVRKVLPESLRLGDVVVNVTREDWFVHRLIARRVVEGQKVLVTKGDNCSDADEPWPVTQLGGVVVAKHQSTQSRNNNREWQQTDLMKWQARAFNWVIAFASYLEYVVGRLPDNIVRRVARSASHGLVRSSVWLGRQLS